MIVHMIRVRNRPGGSDALGLAVLRSRQDRWFLAGAAALISALLWMSTPRVVGDGGEFLTVATRLAHFESPAMTRAEVDSAAVPIQVVPARDGRFETVHFWTYSLLAVPALWLTNAVGMQPTWAFTFLNCALLAGAALVILESRSAPSAGIMFLVISPILWWVDKVHSEVFTYSLLLSALALLAARPWLGAVLAAIASTQNPPIAAVIPLVWILFPEARSRKWWLIVAIAIALIHPMYYMWRIGYWTPLLDGDLRIPTAVRLAAIPFDLNIGLLPNAPFFVLTVVVGAVASLRQGVVPRREWLLVTLTAIWFLFAFAQKVNLNHGGTPSMSRYGFWLMPLAVPFLFGSTKPLGASAYRWSAPLMVCMLASCVWSIAWFRPSLPEHWLEPTRVAMFQWTHYPGLLNPVPEIFAERLRHQDAVNTLASTPGCEKILLQGGVWPDPCHAFPTPRRCQGSDVLCYANRVDDGYEFVNVPWRGGYHIGWPLEHGR
jgi:hypothetical protein